MFHAHQLMGMWVLGKRLIGPFMWEYLCRSVASPADHTPESKATVSHGNTIFWTDRLFPKVDAPLTILPVKGPISPHLCLYLLLLVFSLSLSLSLSLCVCVCVCVCERERERERAVVVVIVVVVVVVVVVVIVMYLYVLHAHQWVCLPLLLSALLPWDKVSHWPGNSLIILGGGGRVLTGWLVNSEDPLVSTLNIGVSRIMGRYGDPLPCT